MTLIRHAIRLFLSLAIPLPLLGVTLTPPAGTGYNLSGQLGNGTTTNRTEPGSFAGSASFTDIAAGLSHTIGIKEDGTLWAWGHNASGQLGDGTGLNRTVPTAVSTAGVLAGRTALSVASDRDSSYAVLDDGTVAAWGQNQDGELGDGSTINRPAPVLVSGLTTVEQVEGGFYHALALLADGTVRAWGYNGQGQLGDGTVAGRTTPVTVTGLANVAGLAAGDFHSVALLDDGTVMAWGFNGSGQIGDGTNLQRKLPVPITGLTDVVEIAAGALHTVARRSDGTVWTWGENQSGALGLGDTVDRATPQPVPGITTAVEIAAAGDHTLVRLSNGSVRAFGSNSFGQFGDDTTTSQTTPIAVAGIASVTSIATGAFHTYYFLPVPPVVTVGAATDITTTTAKLHGTVNPSSFSTAAQFEYGLTATYGSTAPVTLTPNDGDTAQAVTADITGLVGGRTYFFRLTATNDGGTTVASGTFITKKFYLQWKEDFLGDPNAPDTGDPDLDRVPNIVEYVLGTNPTIPGVGPASGLENSRLAISFPRSAMVNDVGLAVQSSENLTTWSDIASSANGAPLTALLAGVEILENAGIVTVRDQSPVTTEGRPKRFLRLKVTP